jgi:peptidoglycan L-alanyl-D-glutamate endopeptidase CwlK
MTLNQRSLDNLKGVHPDLVRVVHRAAELSPMPFVVTEGLRNLERQKELKAAGKSWTLDSRHLTGHAVDVVDADNFGYDMPDLTVIAKAMRQAAAEFKVPIKWGANKKHGGDFKSINDSPHFELDAKAYPASGISVSTKAKEVAAKVVFSRPGQLVIGTVTGGAAASGGAAPDSTPVPPVPAPSIPVPPDLAPVTAWKGFGAELVSLGSWAWANPLISAGLVLWVLACMFLIPRLVGRTT